MKYNINRVKEYWSRRVKEKSFISAVLNQGHLKYINFYYSEWINKLIFRLLPSSVRKVADIGCGAGRLVLPLANKFEVVGVDISFDMLLTLKERLKSKRDTNISIVNASVSQIPFKKNTFDCIISTEVIFHLPYNLVKKAFIEFYSALKSGGYLIITSNNRFSLSHRHLRLHDRQDSNGYYFHIYNLQEIRKIAKESDFNIRIVYGDPLQSILNALDRIWIIKDFVWHAKRKLLLIWKPLYAMASYLDRRALFRIIYKNFADHFLIMFERVNK